MPKKTLLFMILILFSISINASLWLHPTKAYSYDYVYPSNDSKTLNTMPDTNYGSTPTNTLGNMTEWAGSSQLHIGYFKFDMADFDPDLKSGQELQYLNFYFDLFSDFHYYFHVGDNYFRLCYSLNQTWTETQITWNDSPSYMETSEIVEVTGQDRYFTWDLKEISLDVMQAIEGANNFTVVILYYGSTQGFNCRFREYGGISYDPRIEIQYEIITDEEDIYETEPSLASFPIALGQALHIGDFGGRMLASLIIICMFMLPTAFVTQGHKDSTVIIIIIGLGVYGFLLAIQYLPIWSLLIMILLIALIYSNKITGVFRKT